MISYIDEITSHIGEQMDKDRIEKEENINLTDDQWDDLNWEFIHLITPYVWECLEESINKIKNRRIENE